MVAHSDSSRTGDVCLMLPLATKVNLELLLVNNQNKSYWFALNVIGITFLHSNHLSSFLWDL